MISLVPRQLRTEDGVDLLPAREFVEEFRSGALF